MTDRVSGATPLAAWAFYLMCCCEWGAGCWILLARQRAPEACARQLFEGLSCEQLVSEPLTSAERAFLEQHCCAHGLSLSSASSLP